MGMNLVTAVDRWTLEDVASLGEILPAGATSPITASQVGAYAWGSKLADSVTLSEWPGWGLPKRRETNRGATQYAGLHGGGSPHMT
jgi:hypothetical protein